MYCVNKDKEKFVSSAVEEIISTTKGLSEEPMFIAAEQLLLEAYLGYLYIDDESKIACGQWIEEIKDMLSCSEPNAIIYGTSCCIEDIFESLCSECEENFAVEKYEELKAHLIAMPGLAGIFLSCSNRIRKLERLTKSVKAMEDAMNVL